MASIATDNSLPNDVLSTAGSWVIDAETEHLRCMLRPWIGLWTIHARPDFSCLLPKVRNVGIMGLLSILNIVLFSCLRGTLHMDNLEVHKWLTFYVLQESRSSVGCNPATIGSESWFADQIWPLSWMFLKMVSMARLNYQTSYPKMFHMISMIFLFYFDWLPNLLGKSSLLPLNTMIPIIFPFYPNYPLDIPIIVGAS